QTQAPYTVTTATVQTAPPVSAIAVGQPSRSYRKTATRTNAKNGSTPTRTVLAANRMTSTPHGPRRRGSRRTASIAPARRSHSRSALDLRRCMVVDPTSAGRASCGRCARFRIIDVSLGVHLPGNTTMRTLTLVTALAAMAGCTSSVGRPDFPAADSLAAASRAEEQRLAAPAGLSAYRQKQVAVTADAAPIPNISLESKMVIRTGQTSIEVDSLERAVGQVRLLAGRVGGYVAHTTMQTGRGQLRSASLEGKIPAERFDDGLSGLAGLGKLESVNVNAEDVGEEFSDVTARIGNARRLEARLIELLATRTGKLTDVLNVEKELARVREEIDRYEGRLRSLRAHAGLSTLSISVQEPLPVVGHAGSSVIGEAFKQS